MELFDVREVERDVVLAMLRREDKLRKSDEVQKRHGEISPFLAFLSCRCKLFMTE
jgi:hypothetical protein